MNQIENKSENILPEVRDSLVSTALSDVQKSLLNIGLEDPYHKRVALRAIISAIEAILWVYRDYVKSIALELEILDPPNELAFDEKSYRISEQGDLKEQIRYSSMTSMIRYTVKQAQKIEPSIMVDFGVEDWVRLQNAIELRNQITHPKQVSDLHISEIEVQSAFSALSWFGQVVAETTETITQSVKHDLSKMKAFLDFIKPKNKEV